MKLGELFVDLGVNSGGAFNALSSFAFKFENIASMATRLGDILDNVFGDTPKYAVSLKDFSMATGLSIEQLQAMEKAAKLAGTDLNSMLGLFNKARKEYNDWQEGLNPRYAEKMLKTYGITADELQRMKDPMQIIYRQIQALNRMPAQKRFTIIGSGEFPVEMLKAYNNYAKEGNEFRRDALNLDKEEIDALNEIDQLSKLLAIDADKNYNKMIAGIAKKGWYQDSIKGLQEIQNGFYDAIGASDSLWEAIKNGSRYSWDTFKNLSESLSEVIDDTGILKEIVSNLFNILEYAGNAFLDLPRVFMTIIKVVAGVGKMISSFLSGFKSGGIRGAFSAAGDAMDEYVKDLEELWGDSNTANRIKKDYGITAPQSVSDGNVGVVTPVLQNQTPLPQSTYNYSPIYNNTITTTPENVGTVIDNIAQTASHRSRQDYALARGYNG